MNYYIKKIIYINHSFKYKIYACSSFAWLIKCSYICRYPAELSSRHRGQNRIPVNYKPSQYLEASELKGDQSSDSHLQIMSLKPQSEHRLREKTSVPLRIRLPLNRHRVGGDNYYSIGANDPITESMIVEPTGNTVHDIFEDVQSSRTSLAPLPSDEFDHNTIESTTESPAAFPFRFTFPTLFTIPPQFKITPANSLISNIWESISSPSNLYQSWFSTKAGNVTELDVPAVADQLVNQLRTDYDPEDPNYYADAVNNFIDEVTYATDFKNDVVTNFPIPPNVTQARTNSRSPPVDESFNYMKASESSVRHDQLAAGHLADQLAAGHLAKLPSTAELLFLKERFRNATKLETSTQQNLIFNATPGTPEIETKIPTDNDLETFDSASEPLKEEISLADSESVNNLLANENSSSILSTEHSEIISTSINLGEESFAYMVTTPFSYLALKEKYKSTTAEPLKVSINDRPTESDVLTQDFLTSVLALLGLENNDNHIVAHSGFGNNTEEELHFVIGSTTPMSYLTLKEKYKTSTVPSADSTKYSTATNDVTAPIITATSDGTGSSYPILETWSGFSPTTIPNTTSAAAALSSEVETSSQTATSLAAATSSLSVATSSLTVATSSLIVATSSLTVATNSLTVATSSLSVSTSSLSVAGSLSVATSSLSVAISSQPVATSSLSVETEILTSTEYTTSYIMTSVSKTAITSTVSAAVSSNDFLTAITTADSSVTFTTAVASIASITAGTSSTSYIAITSTTFTSAVLSSVSNTAFTSTSITATSATLVSATASSTFVSSTAPSALVSSNTSSTLVSSTAPSTLVSSTAPLTLVSSNTSSTLVPSTAYVTIITLTSLETAFTSPVSATLVSSEASLILISSTASKTAVSSAASIPVVSLTDSKTAVSSTTSLTLISSTASTTAIASTISTTVWTLAVSSSALISAASSAYATAITSTSLATALTSTVSVTFVSSTASLTFISSSASKTAVSSTDTKTAVPSTIAKPAVSATASSTVTLNTSNTGIASSDYATVVASTVSTVDVSLTTSTTTYYTTAIALATISSSTTSSFSNTNSLQTDVIVTSAAYASVTTTSTSSSVAMSKFTISVTTSASTVATTHVAFVTQNISLTATSTIAVSQTTVQSAIYTVTSTTQNPSLPVTTTDIISSTTIGDGDELFFTFETTTPYSYLKLKEKYKTSTTETPAIDNNPSIFSLPINFISETVGNDSINDSNAITDYLENLSAISSTISDILASLSSLGSSPTVDTTEASYPPGDHIIVSTSHAPESPSGLDASTSHTPESPSGLETLTPNYIHFSQAATAEDKIDTIYNLSTFSPAETPIIYVTTPITDEDDESVINMDEVFSSPHIFVTPLPQQEILNRNTTETSSLVTNTEFVQYNSPSYLHLKDKFLNSSSNSTKNAVSVPTENYLLLVFDSTTEEIMASTEYIPPKDTLISQLNKTTASNGSNSYLQLKDKYLGTTSTLTRPTYVSQEYLNLKLKHKESLNHKNDPASNNSSILSYYSSLSSNPSPNNWPESMTDLEDDELDRSPVDILLWDLPYRDLSSERFVQEFPGNNTIITEMPVKTQGVDNSSQTDDESYSFIADKLYLDRDILPAVSYIPLDQKFGALINNVYSPSSRIEIPQNEVSSNDEHLLHTNLISLKDNFGTTVDPNHFFLASMHDIDIFEVDANIPDLFLKSVTASLNDELTTATHSNVLFTRESTIHNKSSLSQLKDKYANQLNLPTLSPENRQSTTQSLIEFGSSGNNYTGSNNSHLVETTSNQGLHNETSLLLLKEKYVYNYTQSSPEFGKNQTIIQSSFESKFPTTMKPIFSPFFIGQSNSNVGHGNKSSLLQLKEKYANVSSTLLLSPDDYKTNNHSFIVSDNLTTINPIWNQIYLGDSNSNFGQRNKSSLLQLKVKYANNSDSSMLLANNETKTQSIFVSDNSRPINDAVNHIFIGESNSNLGQRNKSSLLKLKENYANNSNLLLLLVGSNETSAQTFTSFENSTTATPITNQMAIGDSSVNLAQRNKSSLMQLKEQYVNNLNQNSQASIVYENPSTINHGFNQWLLEQSISNLGQRNKSSIIQLKEKYENITITPLAPVSVSETSSEETGISNVTFNPSNVYLVESSSELIQGNNSALLQLKENYKNSTTIPSELSDNKKPYPEAPVISENLITNLSSENQFEPNFDILHRLSSIVKDVQDDIDSSDLPENGSQNIISGFNDENRVAWQTATGYLNSKNNSIFKDPNDLASLNQNIIDFEPLLTVPSVGKLPAVEIEQVLSQLDLGLGASEVPVRSQFTNVQPKQSVLYRPAQPPVRSPAHDRECLDPSIRYGCASCGTMLMCVGTKAFLYECDHPQVSGGFEDITLIFFPTMHEFSLI